MKAIINHRSVLGESPLWDPNSDTLWWVDIKSSALHQLYDSKHTVHPCPFRPTALGQCDSENLLVAAETSLYFYNIEQQNFTKIIDLPEPQSNRTNDGKVGPDGAFWFGTMDDNEKQKLGSVYSYHPQRGLVKHLESIGISNTFAWSPNGDTMYFADSMEQIIWAFDFEITSGSLSNRRIFVSLKGTECYPDGSAVDSDGYLWNAQWGGSRVVRYDLQGSINKIVDVPTSQPTSVAFQGTNLIITTASIGLDDDQAGLTYTTSVGISGTTIQPFAQ